MRERDGHADAPALPARRRRARRGRRRGRLRARPRCSTSPSRCRWSRSAAQPAGLPARQHAWTATLARDSDGNPISPRFDRLLFFDVRASPPPPASARLLEAALRTLERTYHVGALRPAVHRRLGAAATSSASLGVALADPAGQGPVGLRAAGDRRLRPLPAPRLRRRAAARGGRGGARARRAARRRRRIARHLAGASLARDPHRASSARDCPRRTRTSAGSRRATRCRGARRSSWASSRACARTRRARTT